jgi:flagellar L-ring protein precursor FlgH
MHRLHRIIGVAMLFSFAIPVKAESIWQRRAHRQAFLFQDNRARNVGDVLSVVILENSEIGQREQRGLKKATDTSVNFDYSGTTASDGTSRSAAVEMDLQNSSGRQFDGAAQFTSDRRFLDKLTVTVVDVLPNGNLVIEGRRMRTISGERRYLRITGVVRPADISPQNVVFSESVANFAIEYCGRGVDTHFTSQGWLGRIGNWLWPW